jgi:hypothetical protein
LMKSIFVNRKTLTFFDSLEGEIDTICSLKLWKDINDDVAV